MHQALIDELLACLKMIDHQSSYFKLPSIGFDEKLGLKSHNHFFIIDINRKGRKNLSSHYN
ncbi:hypothetical protein [Oceanobacillus sojae]|uniref:hypothetical protein n=1 Tax=Oceanobacillus sojae TaxID=582851 RepID=UPI0009887C68|nr:hypothetical protein [Oceanobacillus sojae]MCT1903828.1 hypothetical protein [Oceanobacillus sojae]